MRHALYARSTSGSPKLNHVNFVLLELCHLREFAVSFWIQCSTDSLGAAEPISSLSMANADGSENHGLHTTTLRRRRNGRKDKHVKTPEVMFNRLPDYRQAAIMINFRSVHPIPLWPFYAGFQPHGG